ncbi:glucan biosynthesis glucosyltransferase H, partial [Methylobacterium sp. WL116]
LDEADALAALHADPALVDAHTRMLPSAEPRPRGRVDVDHTLAQAKVVEAETLDEARTWLSPRERMALLHDRALLDRLARLAP